MNEGGVAGSRSSHRRVTAVEAGPGAVAIPAAPICGGGSARQMRWERGSRKTNLEIVMGMVSPLWSSSAVIPLAFLLICIIFYIFSGCYPHEQGYASIYGSDRVRLPLVTIFAAPRLIPSSSGDGLTGTLGGSQELAIRSWLALSPDISVVLFGQHPSLVAFAGTLGPRVSVESAIDFTFLGTPLFHSMVARAQASQSNISVLIDPDTILLPDFAITLHNALQLEHDWLLVSIPRSVSTLSETGKQFLTEDGGGIKFEELRKILVRDLHSSSCSDRALIAWNKGNLSLHSIFLPPFINGKGLHNQWLIHQALASDLRLVIDASESISSFYPEVSEHGQLLRESDRERSNESPWESNVNARLAASYGSLGSSPDKYSNLVRLVVCFALHIFYDSTKDTVYVSHQHGRSGPNKVPGQDQGHSLKLNEEKRWRNCIGSTNLPHREDKCSLTEWLRVNSRVRTQVGLPFSLESLLQITADENRTIVLAVAGYSYKDMLMSWVCRMRHLSVTNFLIGALDSDIYDFSVLQGLPVFKDPLPPANIRLTSCHFGTDCFRKVSKVKSRLVLQILRMGYNVLLSDVDVYWFQNPLPFLQKFDPPVLLAQSDEYNETGPINLPRRLNSGFYYARADPPTIAAFAKVVKHASTSNMSEQPSFYDILCGVGGTHRTSDEHCVEPETNLRVIFLDRNLFPNGAFRSLWLERDVRRACKALGCLILHNNWISGKDNKVKRQIRSGLWAYDVHSRMCLQGPKMVSP